MNHFLSGHWCRLLLLLALATGMPGCAVVTVAGSVAGTAVSVAGTVVSTTVAVTGKVIEKTVDVATSSGDQP
jgi:hypothetical protein